MTHHRSAPEIDVDVNVKVTLPGGAGVEVGVPIRWRAPKQEASVGSILLDTPAVDGGGQRTAQLWSDGTTWYICATGRLLDSTAPYVIGEVYPGNTVFGQNPPPPFGDPAHRSAQVDTSYASCPWQFTRQNTNLLPVPAPAGSGSTSYALGLWAQFDGNASYTFQPYSFFGVPSTQTDCDTGSGPFFPSNQFPVLRASPAPGGSARPGLVGVVREKSGRFNALPEQASFAWDAGQGAWVWIPPAGQCGTFTLEPYKDTFVLHCTAAEPPVVAPLPGGSLKPLQLTFEVTARAGKSGKAERLVLDVRPAAAEGPH